MAFHNELGKWGEDIAAQYLREKGWYIRHRDWHYGHRDLDIVAIDAEASILLVVEVKTRTTEMWGQPDEAIDLEKQNNILKATAAYQRECYLSHLDVRFDTISIVGTKENYKLEHKEDAFDASSSFFYNEQRRKRSYYKRRPGMW